MIKIFRVDVWNDTQRKHEYIYDVQFLLQDEAMLDNYRKADNEIYSAKISEKYGKKQKIEVMYHYVIYNKNTEKKIIEQTYDPYKE